MIYTYRLHAVKLYHCHNANGPFDGQIGFGTHSVRQCEFDGTCKWTFRSGGRRVYFNTFVWRNLLFFGFYFRVIREFSIVLVVGRFLVILVQKRN